jgi:hypothetical protein
MFKRLNAITSPSSLKVSSINAPDTVEKAIDSKIKDKNQAGNAPQATAQIIEYVGSRSYLSDHQSKITTEEDIKVSSIK